jgi:hypothetical protein
VKEKNSEKDLKVRKITKIEIDQDKGKTKKLSEEKKLEKM